MTEISGPTKEKGRDVLVWTLVGVVPFVNFIGLIFFVGAANFRLECVPQWT